ncbi:MAG: radical SAM protein [Candidatus Nitrosocaldus sp.]|nr:radical SAM protein [Candidatus Nitrosocaldus sp.]MDW8000673.1 radical SAM protein [Candidatus Nitrosocaldus sp.]
MLHQHDVKNIINMLKDPTYWHISYKAIRSMLGKRSPFYGSADVTNYCNLHCSHCYWWASRNSSMQELSVEGWKRVIDEIFKKRYNVVHVYLLGGEPYLRPDVIELFSKEMHGKCTVVTNATLPILFFKGIVLYIFSVDGPREVHDMIRGKTYDRVRQNITEFTSTYGRKGKGFYTTVNVTINSLNYKHVARMVDEWEDVVEGMVFQFYTPFSENDPLWLPFGRERDMLIDELIRLKREHYGFILNTEAQLNVSRRPWGNRCPNWMCVAVDAFGRIKSPCSMGSADPDMPSPICERCGCLGNCLAYTYGLRGDPGKEYNVYSRDAYASNSMYGPSQLHQ